MPSSTKPRSSTPRASHTPFHPPISYPLSSNRPTSQDTIVALSTSMPPPKTSSHAKRPSLSNTMNWLSRSSTQSSSSSPYAPSKPSRISEPKLVRSIELLSQPRTGVLGTGAIVVRTPDEALRETGVRLTYGGKVTHLTSDNKPNVESPFFRTPSVEEPPSPPNSPPLPPLPLQPEADDESVYSTDGAESRKAHPPPSRTPPPPPSTPEPSLRPSLKRRTSSHSRVEDVDVVPPLPRDVPLMPTPPPFRLLLVSERPSTFIDPSLVIVTLETSTTTYRTTLQTINSRPSHLSRQINELFSQQRRDSTTSSVYSTTSDNDLETYRHHLTSQGLLPRTPFNLHVFLDRPSTPYLNVLNYLRSPVGTAECPEILPRAVQLYSSSNSRFEGLLELRDEAAYLGLEDLHRLCSEEIRLRHGARVHTRGNSNTSTAGSAHSLHASVYSLHTLLERVESDIRSSSLTRINSTESHKSGQGVPTHCEGAPPVKSPPTPRSWEQQAQGRRSPSRTPPAGWI